MVDVSDFTAPAKIVGGHFHDNFLILVSREGSVILHNLGNNSKSEIVPPEKLSVKKTFFVDVDKKLFLLTDKGLYLVDIVKHEFNIIDEFSTNFIDFCVLENKATVYLAPFEFASFIEEKHRSVKIPELYKGIKCVKLDTGEIIIILVGLWGYTCMNIEGKELFYKTFGDIVNTVEVASIDGEKLILTGSKNGWFYVGNMSGDIKKSFSLGKSLSMFSVPKKSIGDVFWVGFDGSINYFNLIRDIKVELLFVDIDVEKITSEKFGDRFHIFVSEGKEYKIIEIMYSELLKKG